MQTARAQEIYESILQSLFALKREVEGTGDTGRPQATSCDFSVLFPRSLPSRRPGGGNSRTPIVTAAGFVITMRTPDGRALTASLPHLC